MKIEKIKNLVTNLHDKTEYLFIDMNASLKQKAKNKF